MSLEISLNQPITSPPVSTLVIEWIRLDPVNREVVIKAEGQPPILVASGAEYDALVAPVRDAFISLVQTKFTLPQ
jgi:hypothetical protein